MTEAIGNLFGGENKQQKRLMELQQQEVLRQRDIAQRADSEEQNQLALQPRNRGGRRLLQYLEGSSTLGG